MDRPGGAEKKKKKKNRCFKRQEVKKEIACGDETGERETALEIGIKCKNCTEEEEQKNSEKYAGPRKVRAIQERRPKLARRQDGRRWTKKNLSRPKNSGTFQERRQSVNLNRWTKREASIQGRTVGNTPRDPWPTRIQKQKERDVEEGALNAAGCR